MKEIKKLKRINGITLIALVVTIVVLLILAGVSINMVFDSDGLFKKASGTAGKYNEAKAREALETVLMGKASMEKYTNPIYNQDDFLDSTILTEISNSKVQGNIAIVEGYAYELDRSVPKIGKYLGREEDLVFPEVSVSTPQLATDSRTATFTITAKEEEHGINKIEVLQQGKVVKEFTYSNVTEPINQPVTVKRNGKYTVKAYSNLTGTARTEVLGIVTSVEFSPNGDTTWKKEHSTTITVKETEESIKSLKYQWSTSVTEPEENTFIKECSNNSTITGKGEEMTGTYFLWVLLETNTGKKNICGSEAFNFDNKGPDIIDFTLEKLSENGITINLTAQDTGSGIFEIKFYVDNKLEATVPCGGTRESVTKSIDVTGLSMGEHNCKVIVTDGLQNSNEDEKAGKTMMYTWECYNMTTTHNYRLGAWTLFESTGIIWIPWTGQTCGGSYGCDSTSGQVWHRDGISRFIHDAYVGDEFWFTSNNSSANPLEHYVEKWRVTANADEKGNEVSHGKMVYKQSYNKYRAYVEDSPTVSVGEFLKLVTADVRNAFPDEGELETDTIEGTLKQYHFVWKGIE